MVGGRDPGGREHSGQPPRGLVEGSGADIQEQEQPWGAEEPEADPEQPERLGIETPEADALEQTRDWGAEDEEDR
jgi:hypothetical protein